jgi:hypothetical protein
VKSKDPLDRPLKLKLLPGLRWKGKLTVRSREPDGYAVCFDAEINRPESEVRHNLERYIFDHAVLSAKQLVAWTGWSE